MSKWFLAALCCAAFSVNAQTTNTLLTNTLLPRTGVPTAVKPAPLAWDSVLKTYDAKAGEQSAEFTFSVTNTSSAELTINGTQSGCGCTIAKMPSQPWKMAPGESGQIQITVDIRRKTGTLIKGITVLTSAGLSTIQVKITVPPPVVMSAQERARNAEMAKADSQAIFKGSCATCHVNPAKGRMGSELYAIICGICHEGTRRATMVPNLHGLTKKTDFEFWKDAIVHGRTNSLMPGFAIEQGGPLTEDQINSVALFLNQSISRNLTPPPSLKNSTLKSFEPEIVPVQVPTPVPSATSAAPSLLTVPKAN